MTRRPSPGTPAGSEDKREDDAVAGGVQPRTEPDRGASWPIEHGGDRQNADRDGYDNRDGDRQTAKDTRRPNEKPLIRLERFG
jgi:hypothetical protein